VEYERRARVGKQKRAFARCAANIFKYMHDVLPAVRFFCIYIIYAPLQPTPVTSSRLRPPCGREVHEYGKISLRSRAIRINESVHAYPREKTSDKRFHMFKPDLRRPRVNAYSQVTLEERGARKRTRGGFRTCGE